MNKNTLDSHWGNPNGPREFMKRVCYKNVGRYKKYVTTLLFIGVSFTTRMGVFNEKKTINT